MSRTVWLIPVSALIVVAGAAIGLQSMQEVPGAAAALAERPAAAVGSLSGNRVYLSTSQQAEARKSGSWLHDLHSLLRVERPLRYGQFVWNDPGGNGPIWIRVDLRTQIMSVFRGGHEIGTTVVLYGADGKETPTGIFPVLWRKRDHVSSLYDAPMPYTLRLTNDGIAIHGSDVRWGAATHGCVGVPKEFASHLFEVTRVGDQVTIVRTPSPETA